MRQDTIEQIRQRLVDPPACCGAPALPGWGSLKRGGAAVVSRKQLEITPIPWAFAGLLVQDCLKAGLFEWGRAHLRHDQQREHEGHSQLRPGERGQSHFGSPHSAACPGAGAAGITANAILAGVTDTPASRLIPDFEKIFEIARLRNPHKRLTVPEDVARCIAACATATYWLTGNTLHVDGGGEHRRMIRWVALVLF